MTYDAEGLNRNINVGLDSAHDRNTEKLDDAENQLPGHADVAAPDGPEDESGTGYLWDGALRSGLRVRNYGFFIDLSHYSIVPEPIRQFRSCTIPRPAVHVWPRQPRRICNR